MSIGQELLKEIENYMGFKNAFGFDEYRYIFRALAYLKSSNSIEQMDKDLRELCLLSDLELSLLLSELDKKEGKK